MKIFFKNSMNIKQFIQKNPSISFVIMSLMPAVIGYLLTAIYNGSVVSVTSGLMGQLIAISNNKDLLSNIYFSGILMLPIFIIWVAVTSKKRNKMTMHKLIYIYVIAITFLIIFLLLIVYGLPQHALENPRKAVGLMVLASKTSISFSFFVSFICTAFSIILYGLTVLTLDMFKTN